MFRIGLDGGCVFHNVLEKVVVFPNVLHGGCVFRIGLDGGCVFPNGLEKDVCSLMEYAVDVCFVLN